MIARKIEQSDFSGCNGYVRPGIAVYAPAYLYGVGVIFGVGYILYNVANLSLDALFKGNKQRETLISPSRAPNPILRLSDI